MKHDGEGIIGDRPEPDLGPLFRSSTETPKTIWGFPVVESADLQTPDIVLGAEVEALAIEVDRLVMGSAPATCGICGDSFGEGEAPVLCFDLSRGAVHAECARDRGLLDVERPVDSVPLDPRKPEPPTKEERAAAIERVKAAVIEHLCTRAKARVGLPLASAGVTADDVWDLGRHVPAAALLGTADKAWSWTGAWLAKVARAGRLAPFFVEGIPVTRRAVLRDRSHGNAHRVYLHPDDPRVVGGARSQRPEP